jgi:hypothetical protein
LKLYYGTDINSKMDFLLLNPDFTIIRIGYSDRLKILSCLSTDFEILQQSAFLPSIRF